MENMENSFRWKIGISASNHLKLVPFEVLSFIIFPIGIAMILFKNRLERDFYIHFTERSVYIGTVKSRDDVDFSKANFYDPNLMRSTSTMRMFPKVTEIPYYLIHNIEISKNGWDLIIVTDTYKTKIRVDTPDKDLIFKIQSAFSARVNLFKAIN